MHSLTNADGGEPAPDALEDSDTPEGLLLSRLRPLLQRGHVFAMDDAVSGRTSAEKYHRPVVLTIVQPLEPQAGKALQQRVQVCPRLGWKPAWGIPGSPEARALVARMKWIFSPRKSLPAFNKDGVFELDKRFPVTVAELLQCPPLGWLPQPAIDAILAHAGARLPDPYPPVNR